VNTTTSTARDPIAQAHARAVEADQAARAAQQEMTDAQGLVTALERRVLAGDETVTSTEITTARELADFGRLRAQAAATKAETARAAHRRAQLDALAAEMREHVDDGDDFDAALSGVESALARLVDLGRRRQAACFGYRQRMQALGVAVRDPRQPEGHGLPEDAGLTFTTPPGPTVAVDGTIVREVDVTPFILGALYRLDLYDGAGRLRGERIHDLTGLDGQLDLHAELRRQLS
jgi:hypothetical protein